MRTDEPRLDRWPLPQGREVVAALRESASPGRLYARTAAGDMVKVVAPSLDPTASLRVNDAAQEANILRSLSPLKRIPTVTFLDVNDEWQAVGLKWIDGRPLTQLELKRRHKASIVATLFRTLVALSWRGVSHNDIKVENVLVSDDRTRVWLIDFDQATVGHQPWRALIRNLIGSQFFRNEVVVHGSLRTLIRSLRRRRTLAAQRRLPSIQLARTAQQQTLYRAWELAQSSDANAPGDRVAYYELNVDGLVLPGERSWEDRWRVLRTITPFKDKRVLELGCNMGLLSVYVKRFEDADSVWGVDHDPLILECAALVARAYGVEGRWSCVDLARDAEAVAELIDYKADVITCLNVWHWVSERTLLRKLLASASEVIFEGHASEAEEIATLEGLGFTHVSVLAVTERGRAVLHATRD